MNHLMTQPLASMHVGILTQAGEEVAPEEHGLHTFILTPSRFLLMNSLRIFYVLYFLFLVEQCCKRSRKLFGMIF